MAPMEERDMLPQQQPLVVGHLEDRVEDALLGVVQVQQAREQQRPHFRDRGAHPVALLAEQVPEHHREGLEGVVVQADGRSALHQLGVFATGLADTRQVAFDIGHEHRHAAARKVLGQNLQGDCLAGTGGTGDQAMPVGKPRQQVDGLGPLADENTRIFLRGHVVFRSSCFRLRPVPSRPVNSRSVRL